MKFIEIAQGLSIRIDEIEAVGQRDGMVSVVYTHHNTFDSTFPYDVLLDLLEQESKDGDKVEQQKLNILKTLGTFGA